MNKSIVYLICILFMASNAYATQNINWSDNWNALTWTADKDGDGISDDLDPDDDNDGVLDVDDAFPLDANEYADNDNDGIGNNADLDDDNDGLPDTWEIQYGLNPFVADANQDADNDGVSNINEYINGTSPVDYDYAGNTPGVTPGEFSVDASGSANYTIPIAVPPGTAGMQPSLTLSYNHRSGNGLLGVGWTLGGLSVITRCPAAKVIDGFIDGVDFDSNDRFCIDGQRLIAVNGTYGANNTEYRTEVDGFTQVISYDTDLTKNGPEYFIAKTKSGQILEYGNTTDSHIEAQGKNDARLWAVNKISDTTGNYLTVIYHEDTSNGSYRPTQIDYTGNASASPALTPNTQITFEYETRTDTPILYFAGSKVQNTQRLTNIKTYTGTTLVRDYQLTYDNNGAANRSRLISLTECDRNTISNCFRPMVFNWSDDSNGLFAGPGISNNYGVLPNMTHAIADFNGDGLSDVIRIDNNSQQIWAYRSYGNGLFAGPGISNNYGVLPNMTHAIADFNGDGLSDVIRIDKNSQQIWAYRSYGNGLFAGPGISNNYGVLPNMTHAIADFNGDGLSDVIRIDNNSQQIWAYSYQGDLPPNIIDQITNSLGQKTTVTYKSITDSTVYTKGSGASYPEVDIQAPMYVVSKVTVDDGVGGTRDTTYTYSEAKSSLDGRGFLGFKTMTAVDSSTGIKTTTIYKQTHPYIGLVERTEQRLSDNTLVGEVDTTFANQQTHSGVEVDVSHPGVLFPYAATVTKKDYEID